MNETVTYLEVISLALISVIVCCPFSKENHVFLSTIGIVHSAETDAAIQWINGKCGLGVSSD